MFLITNLFARQSARYSQLLALAPVAVVKHFAIWQLVTYLFLHGGIWHLLFNMLALWMFGTPLERDWGTRRFLKYYFICGIGAGICDVLAECRNGQLGNQHHRRVGRDLRPAAGLWRLLPGPDRADELPVPDQGQVHGHDLRGIELYMSIGVNNGVSNIAHLGGMVVGFVYLKSRLPSLRVKLPDWRGAYRQWKLQRAKKKFQVYMRKHGDRGPWVN